jgi:hypothetical protein
LAVIMDWEKRRPLGLSGFKDREMLWLWCQLEVSGYKLNPKLVINSESRANHLIDSIQDDETIRSLRDYRDECFSNRLDDSEFKWISYNDRRLVHWIIEGLDEGHFFIKPTVTKFNQSVLSSYERIPLVFDLSNLDIQLKKEAMLNICQRWSSLIEIDSSLKWVDKKDESQCRWLVDEIKKSVITPWICSSLRSPVSNDGRFLLVVNALDRSGFPLKLKALFLGELKAKWSRRKKKDDTEKVQCNLNVNAPTKENIKKLAVGRKLKRGELIDALVAEEMERRGW